MVTFNISHKLLSPTQFLKKFLKIWNSPPCRNKLGPSPLLNVAVYWQSSNTKACANIPSQTLAITFLWGRGIGLRIYVRYYSKNFWKIKGGFEKPGNFLS